MYTRGEIRGEAANDLETRWTADPVANMALTQWGPDQEINSNQISLMKTSEHWQNSC